MNWPLFFYEMFLVAGSLAAGNLQGSLRARKRLQADGDRRVRGELLELSKWFGADEQVSRLFRRLADGEDTWSVRDEWMKRRFGGFDSEQYPTPGAEPAGGER